MRPTSIYLTFALLAGVALTGCKDDDPNDTSFDNKLYIEAASKVSTLLVKPNTLTASNVIRSSVAKPTAQQIDIVYKVDPDKVELYNRAYYDEAILLPEQNYELPENTAVIPAGSVKSTDINLDFKDLNTLDRKLTYVLPVTIGSASNIPVLESARTVYYILKAGAVINVVANIRNNHLSVKWTKQAVVNSLNRITIEALVRVHTFDHIMTIMGIEDNFLIRISDDGYPSNGLQVATSQTNFPAAHQSPQIPQGVWTQISVTMNAATGDYMIYIDGELKASGTGPQLGTISLATEDDFFIGRSYDKTRWLDGEISECRIWNVIRTQEQIAAGRYEVDPASPGLVAYWKFDEGSGLMVNDRTSNGNHATAESALKWIKVTLPE